MRCLELQKIIYNFFNKLKILNNIRYIFIHKNLQKIFNKKDKSIVLDDCVEIEDFKNYYKIKKMCLHRQFHKRERY